MLQLHFLIAVQLQLTTVVRRALLFVVVHYLTIGILNGMLFITARQIIFLSFKKKIDIEMKYRGML